MGYILVAVVIVGMSLRFMEDVIDGSSVVFIGVNFVERFWIRFFFVEF